MIKPGVIMGQKPNNVNKFWLLYRDVVIGSGIPENTAEWYAHRAQKFVGSIKHVRSGGKGRAVISWVEGRSRRR